MAACYQGFNVRGGAKEVGLATTRAVVAGSVSILVLRLLPDRRFSHPVAVQIVNQPPAPTSQPPAPGAVPAPAANPLAQRDERWQIRVRGLNKTFGPQHVLRGIDLDIERGTTNIIIGGSGQGKSVLMKHLMGLLKPDCGRDLGRRRRRRAAQRRRDGQAAPQVRHGVPVRGAVRFDERRREHRLPAASSATACRATRSWSACAICCGASTWRTSTGIEQKFPPELSGGQRKRVGLARALIDRPEILLYDEPTTGLDPVATKNVDEMIRRTADEFGVTSVVISHDMASTFRIGDRISMLYEGKIVVTGTPEEVLRQPPPGPARVRRDVRPGGARRRAARA